MQLLANNRPPIVAGESAIAGLAGLLIASQDDDLRSKLKLTKDSRILVFGTEGDTDEEMYKNMVGRSASEVLAGNN
jgi:diaminopropionate ammonia-lyase